MKHLKLFFALFAMLALGVGNAWAETATITFKNQSSGTSDSSTAYTKSDFVSSGITSSDDAFGTITCSETNRCYSGKSGMGLKVGGSGKAGSFTIAFAQPIKNVTKITFNTAAYRNAVSVTIKHGTTTLKTISSMNNASLHNEDITDLNIASLESLTIGTNTYSYIKSITVTYEAPSSGGGTEETAASLVSIAHTGDKTTFTEGDAFEKSEITATYDDATTKVVTSLATFTGYDMNTTGPQTVTVTYEDQTITYNITVNPKPTYTITWNNAGTTNTTEVVQGEAFGTLPEPADCDNGKKFMGWTAATPVNNDGSGITYIKPTDKPTANTTYYAVFAVVEGGEGTPTTATVSIANYADAKSWADATQYNTISIDANITATAYGGGNTGKYYENGENWRLYQNESPTLTISAAEGYEIQTVKVTYSVSNTGVLTLDGSNVTSGTACEVNAASVTFGVGNTGSATNGQVRITAIEVVYAPAAAKSDYSLDCELHQDPYLTVTETPIDFGTVAQNETVNETFTVTGGYLAEDVALTISGTNASFFSVSPATITKADEVNETVTVTYNPTEVGDHTATLTIKTGEITKTVALSGTVLAPGKWVLVKDVVTLSAGDEIIIASAVADYAIGVAATNNYKGAAITKVGETANTTADVTILTVEGTGDAEVPYAFKDGSKYLYAAGSDKNYLKAQVTNNVNGQWAVTITAEGVASIVAAKSENRNVMQCNPNSGSPIFACYTSADYQQLAIYRNSENVVKPVISGDADFTGSTQVTITAQSGLTVYYTTDGSDPDNTSTQYTAPFTINATTTVKAIAYDATDNASAVAEMTFTKQELVGVATAMALVKDEIAYFDEFEVVKVVTGKGNIYIKDASGHGLIYDNTLAGELKDGDRVQGFVGISSPYNGLPEAKPVDGLKVADLTITSGVAAEPYDFTSTAIASTDINKYIVFNDVEIATAVSMSNSNKEFSLTINGSNVAFYNQFSIEKTLEAGKTYDIYGFVSIYNEKLQVYFYQALEEDEVVTKYTVTYNAGGATGEVPVDDNEYTKGAQVYLKSATGLTKEGYDYKGWKVTDEGGNEITVSSNKFNMPASNVTVTAQWEEIVVTPRQDFSTGYWVLVTEEGQLAAGDKIVVAAVEEDYAMKSYESGNNCGQIEITKLGEGKFVKWISEVGVFELAANGSNYTIQDVNTKDYLYAAGSGDNNYLKATDEVPTDENQAKYLWTISFTDGVPTVKATSANRNTLKYNTGSNLFACYTSGQEAIALYKYVTSVETTKVSPSVEKGIFSVADDKFVQFSTGNLQYEVGTNTWSFAENQYDYVGEANINVGDPTFTGTIDMFGWSTNDADNNYGVNPNNVNGLYDGTFQDWGTLVDEADWYTLSADEWKYLLNKRANAASLKQIAKIGDKLGIMLFPDAWTMPTDVNVTAAPDSYFKVNIYNYTLEQWQKLEAVGAVFLPAAGRRTGGYGNMINKDQVEETNPDNLNDGHYKHYDNGNIYCYYWTSTINESANVSYLHNIQALGGDKYTINTGAVWGEKGRYGQSVRLVKKVTPNHTRTVTSGDYGTICLPNGGQLVGASAFSVLKMEGTTILLYEVGTTMVAGTPYVVFPNTGAKKLYVFYTDNVNAPAGEANGLYGSYTREELAPNAGYYIMLPGNRYAEVTGDRVFVAANRAYFKVDDIEDISTTAPALAPGVRRIAIGQAPQVATGMENIDASAQPVKAIINGQLFILCGEKMYDAQGKLVK